MYVYKVAVGFTTSRPVVPDEHVSLVTLLAASDAEAILVAAQMVSARRTTVMATRTTILEVEL